MTGSIIKLNMPVMYTGDAEMATMGSGTSEQFVSQKGNVALVNTVSSNYSQRCNMTFVFLSCVDGEAAS